MDRSNNLNIFQVSYAFCLSIDPSEQSSNRKLKTLLMAGILKNHHLMQLPVTNKNKTKSQMALQHGIQNMAYDLSHKTTHNCKDASWVHK